MAETQNDGRERTEAPTPRRLQQAREQGQVARSPEIASALMILGGALLLGGASGEGLAKAASETLRASTAALAAGGGDPGAVTALVQRTGWTVLAAWIPFALALAVISAGSQLVQTGGALRARALQPDLSKLSPMAGLRRVFGVDGWVSAGKSVLRVGLLSGVIALAMVPRWHELLPLMRTGPAAMVEVLRSLGVRLAVSTGAAFLLVAVLDYVIQVVRLRRSLRMTRDEVVREHRESEGDPILKARLRAFGRSLARRRMMQDVPSADVVVVNPTHVAVALRYDPADVPAPVVVAMGERRTAERIRAIAEKAGVPVVQNIAVARALLATATVGRAIPPALFVAVAEILAWVHRRHGLRHVAKAGAA